MASAGPRRAAVFAPVLVLLLSGCGDAGRKQTMQALAGFQLNESDMRMAFGRRSWGAAITNEDLEAHIKRQISRLASPAWEEGWDELRKLGTPAISALIPFIDDTTPTYAGRNPRPGVVNLHTASQLTLGEVVYALLRDMIDQYSNYEGELPPRERAAWDRWWKRNGRSIRMSARMVSKGARKN